MEVADAVPDTSLRALTGNSPILASVSKKFLGQLTAVVQEAVDLCGGGGGGVDPTAGSGESGLPKPAGPLCGVAGCPGYSKAKGWNCTHVITRQCNYELPPKAGGGACGIAHASFGKREWTCAQAKALTDVVSAPAARHSAFKLGYNDWLTKSGSADVAAVKALVAKYTYSRDAARSGRLGWASGQLNREALLRRAPRCSRPPDLQDLHRGP